MIRPADRADTSEIHALLWAAKDDIPLTEKFLTEPYRQWIEKHCEAKKAWVYVMSSMIVGAMVMEGEVIFYLVVSEFYRRKGIGRALIRQAQRQNAMLRATLGRMNLGVQRLFASEGFVEELESDRKWKKVVWSPGG